jgi:hypothetical protein
MPRSTDMIKLLMFSPAMLNAGLCGITSALCSAVVFSISEPIVLYNESFGSTDSRLYTVSFVNPSFVSLYSDIRVWWIAKDGTYFYEGSEGQIMPKSAASDDTPLGFVLLSPQNGTLGEKRAFNLTRLTINSENSPFSLQPQDRYALSVPYSGGSEIELNYDGSTGPVRLLKDNCFTEARAHRFTALAICLGPWWLGLGVYYFWREASRKRTKRQKVRTVPLNFSS